MSKIKIPFNGTNYNVDESSLSDMATTLSSHLSTVMNGTGATVKLGGTSYNVDATKLSDATSAFVTHLGTIAGTGLKVVVDGVEYNVDSSKTSNAVVDLHTALNGLNSVVETMEAGLYETGSNYTVLLKSWDELVNEGSIVVKNGIVYCGTVMPDLPEKNEYGFYYGVLYNNAGYGYMFYEDGSVAKYNGDKLVETYPAGSAVYSANNIDLSAFDYVVMTVTSDGKIVVDEWGNEYSLGLPAQLPGDLMLPINGSITQLGDYRWDDEYGDYVGNIAFAGCTSLTGIKIPDSVTSICEEAFQSCTGLTSIGPVGSGASVEIPNTITSIGESVFYGCMGLTNIEIPDSVTSISEWAFSWCTSLTSVVISDSVTSIGQGAFLDCVNLTSVTFDENSQLASISWGAFEDCTSLTTITIPDSVTTIEGCAFSDCTSLTNVEIGDSVTNIGEGAFGSCTNLTTITFEGTVEQWYAIVCGYKWKDKVPATEVICSNGTVSL